MIARRKVLQGLAATGLVTMDGRSGRAEDLPGPPGAGDRHHRARRAGRHHCALVAAKLTESLGQSFYVENIGGGGGNIAMGTAARAAPDGYTILAATSNLVTNVSLYPKVPYDPDKDFAPISLLCSSPHLLTGASFGARAKASTS
jgi:hypothetical protein